MTLFPDMTFEFFKHDYVPDILITKSISLTY